MFFNLIKLSLFKNDEQAEHGGTYFYSQHLDDRRTKITVDLRLL